MCKSDFEFSTENYTTILENLESGRLQLLRLEYDLEVNESILYDVKSTLNLEDYQTDLTLKHDIWDHLDEVTQQIKDLEKFSDHWQSYEENYSIIQQWLGYVEEELDKEGCIDLISSEKNAMQKIYENACSQFLLALEDKNVLDDEDQRKYKLQIDARWQNIEKDLNKIRESRKEINFNNLQDIYQRTNEIINQGRGVLNSKSFDNNEDLMTYVKKASFLKLKAEIIKEQIHQTNIPDKN